MYYPDYYSTVLNEILTTLQGILSALETLSPDIKYLYYAVYGLLFIETLRLIRGN